MHKVTLIFSIYCILWGVFGCKHPKNQASEELLLNFRDSITETRIDSAYRQIKTDCDSLIVYQVPKMVDSFLRNPASMSAFFDTANQFFDEDLKLEKVVRLLKADCDSSLLKETYRRAQLQQKLKKRRQTKY